MGYLNNSTITVDAIITKKGREILAKNRSDFRITQYALADDEVDYTMWNSAHPLGSSYYGSAIENMPITEAVPDETQNMRYLLITLPKTTTAIPKVTVPQTSYTLTTPGQEVVITPITSNFVDGNKTLGYTAILSDSDAAFLEVVDAAPAKMSASTPRYMSDNESAQSISVVGLSFKVVAKAQPLRAKQCKLVIIGNETGGRQTINITINKTELSNSGI